VFLEEYTGLGLQVKHAAVYEEVQGTSSGVDHELYTRRAGWPFYALECHATADAMKPMVIESGVPVPGWLEAAPTLRTPPGPSLLPTAVLPLGFVEDSAVYGGILLALAVAGRFGFRAWRVMRQRCRECGYDRRGIPPGVVCPECGAAPAT
jgi:hypothetical protein